MFGSNGKKKEPLSPESEALTFLARGFEFNGSLSVDGTVRIDGRVEGEIRSNGSIILGEHAVIKGDISASSLVSGGKINGNIIATEKVHLLASAVLLGDVMTPLLQMDEGVRFHGKCEVEGRTVIAAVQGADDHDVSSIEPRAL